MKPVLHNWGRRKRMSKVGVQDAARRLPSSTGFVGEEAFACFHKIDNSPLKQWLSIVVCPSSIRLHIASCLDHFCSLNYNVWGSRTIFLHCCHSLAGGQKLRKASGMKSRITALDSDIAFATSRLPSLSEEATKQTMGSATTGFEEGLAALRLEVISKPRINMSRTYAEEWTSHTSAVAIAEGKIEQQPRSKPDTINLQREQIQPPELPRFDSTSSMRSLMTDSIFSIGNTTDSYPPSPSSSAHVAEPLHCRSWDLDSCRMLDTSRRIDVWSTLRTGGQKSSLYVNISHF